MDSECTGLPHIWAVQCRFGPDYQITDAGVKTYMPSSMLWATQEVRWFFEGPVDQHVALLRWFEMTHPFPRSAAVGPLTWQAREGDEPDIYLLIPAGDDMGIKWREGRMQIKGRVAALGQQVYCGRHVGKVERWLKWSYDGLPEPYQRLFTRGDEADLRVYAVHKRRILRQIRLELAAGETEEVDAARIIKRGVTLELADIEVADRAYCSLAFEAFPDDAVMTNAFTSVVARILESLTKVELHASQSLSYPTWLSSVVAGGA
jgi:hypothetical protein